ncbi:MAG: hypothetical protein HY898_25475 [Deltaproteobacteria bacterium]|nr:hypothetical protein [Deltaproteobacteria bacterium]
MRVRELCASAARAVLGAACCCVASAACAPGIASDDDIPETLPFDPAATPPLLPQPTNIVVNPSTGRIDFSLAGVDVPEDCAAAQSMSQAQCEFYKYLGALDGFPTDMAATAPVTAPVQTSSLQQLGNVVVVNAALGAQLTDLQLSYDDTTRQIAVGAKQGWDVGSSYFVGVRGYANGIRSTEGRKFVSSVPYVLFKLNESLTCGAKTASELDPRCPYAQLLASPQTDSAQLFRDLSDLESIRQLYGPTLHLWDTLAQVAKLPMDEVASAWAFPTHSGSVIELNPGLGRIPRVVGTSTLELDFKGSVDDSKLTPFSFSTKGTVFLLDLTALEKNDFDKGVPAFTVERTGGVIALKTAAPMVNGDLYGIIVTDGVTNAQGLPFVAPPMAVLLRSRGSLVDSAGHSTVEGVADADAAQLEAGRLDLKALLDDPLFVQLTNLKRENIAYVYAFSFPNP